MPFPLQEETRALPAAKEQGMGAALTALPTSRTIANKQEKPLLPQRAGEVLFCRRTAKRRRSDPKRRPGVRFAGCGGRPPERPHDGQDVGTLVSDGGCPALPEHDIAQVDAMDCRGHISRSGFLPRSLAGARMEPEPQRKPTPCKRQIRFLLRRMAASIAQRFPPSRMAVYRARAGSAEGIRARRQRLGAVCQSCATAPASGKAA